MKAMSFFLGYLQSDGILKATQKIESEPLGTVSPSIVASDEKAPVHSQTPVMVETAVHHGGGLPEQMPVKRPGIEKVFVLGASLLFLTLSILSIPKQSVTDNEALFIPAGLSYLQRRDVRMDIEEPPLVKVIVAIPALLFHPKIDYNDSTWNLVPGSYEPEYLFGHKFFTTWNPNHKAMLFAARLPLVALTLLLGLSLYGMARRLAGPAGAMVTLGLFATSPFFLGYGSMVIMDIAIALFSIWTMWSFASLWRQPTLRNALLFGGSLAAALVTKFSAVFLFPAILLAWVWFRFQERRANRTAPVDVGRHRFSRERLAIGSMVLAGVVVYFFYLGLFYRTDAPLVLNNEAFSMAYSGLHTIPVDVLARRMSNHPALEPILLAPSLYLGGLAYVLGHGNRSMYFLGRMHAHGVWYYFPVMSFFKLAPGMLAILALLAILAIANFRRVRKSEISATADSYRFHVQAMVSVMVVFGAIAMASKLNVGIRHFSVPIAVAVLLCSLVVPLSRSLFDGKAQRFAIAAIAALVFSSLVTALVTYPNYLAYFNVLRLNMPKQEIANNSNLNWGQTGEETAAFFRERGVTAPYVDKISTIDPTVYIPGAHTWECDKPGAATPEWAAVGAYKLTRGMGNCLELERYPSWVIGDGAAVVFHIPQAGSPGNEKAK